jgi:GWxTD domain-containing protein
MLNAIVFATIIMTSGFSPVNVDQTADTVEVSSARFYLPNGATLVDGFVKIPFGILTGFRSSAGTNVAMYRIQVNVSDSYGTELLATDWTGTVPRGLLSTAGASTVEHFSFSVAEGAYTATITVVDSASGVSVSSPVDFSGYDTAPQMSDVVLTNSLRRSRGEGDQPAPGEIQKGSFFLSGSPRPRLLPREATLFYYVELYPEQATSVSSLAQISNTDGRVLFTTPASSMNLSARGGVAARSLDLTGLPPGDYVMELAVSYPDTTVSRVASFSVNDFQVTEPAAAATQSNPFAFQNAQVLDSLYAPLIYLIESEEQDIFEELSVEGKRNFLTEFWASRDQDPDSPGNPVMAAYYNGIAEANRLFGEEGAGGIPGWRTDRGRIFLNHGPPEETLDEAGSGRTNPYEIWKYSRGRALKYIFMDRSRFGHYELVFTNDRNEQGRADWESLFEGQELERVNRF